MSAGGANSEGFEAVRPRARFVGSRLGKYFVGARLAAGGTASVYLARLAGPHNFERLVALKIIHEHLSEEQEFVNMFLDEANLAARLNHPNIVHVYELASDDDVLFLAMEYLHGQPLSLAYRRALEQGELLPVELVSWIGARAADGLQHAHELRDAQGEPLGLVHRDVSPQNIFLTYDGHVKVVDFGIARAAGRIAKTALGQIKGKFSYMSPEQALGKPFDHRADLFALGATLYEAACGTRLFKGEDEIDTLRKVVAGDVPPPEQVVAGFPAEVSRTLLRALAPDPDQRFSDCDALAREFDAFLVGRGVPDQREELARIMARLFAHERSVQERAIAELRDAGVRAEEVAAAPPAEETQVASGLDAPAKPRRSRAVVYLAGAVGVVGSVVGIIALASPTKQPAVASSVASSPPVPETVTIELTVQPDVAATVLVDGRVATGRPARAVLKRSKQSVRVVVSAEGYESSTLTVTADENRSVLVPLRERPPPAPSASAPPTKPEARPPVADPRPRPAPRSKVISDNPF